MMTERGAVLSVGRLRRMRITATVWLPLWHAHTLAISRDRSKAAHLIFPWEDVWESLQISCEILRGWVDLQPPPLAGLCGERSMPGDPLERHNALRYPRRMTLSAALLNIDQLRVVLAA